MLDISKVQISELPKSVHGLYHMTGMIMMMDYYDYYYDYYYDDGTENMA